MPMLALDDVDLYYEARGAGLPLVLIPGLGVGGNIWQPVVPRLALSHQCITVDTRGVGFSSVPRGPYTIEMLAGDLDQLIRRLELDDPVVIGHSMGGFVAQALASHRPTRGLVLISTAASGDPTHGGPLPSANRLFQETASRSAVLDKIIDIGVAPESPAAVREHLKNLLLARPLRGAGYLAQMAAVSRFDMTTDLAELRVPTCIIHGTADRIMAFSSAEYLARHIADAVLHPLVRCGHFPPVEQPEILADIILHFVQTL